ncbi:MAG: lamin tail domain-containing protein [Flavobacteriales bacterium]|nr:lamin tail domain-containing protein [Flavobacteriales bacterium]
MLLSAAIDTGTYNTVTITGINDCEGNPQSGDSTLNFILPFNADSGDLVINEVLFNPVTGGADYVELMNTSDRVVNLKGWMLANFDVDDGIAGHRTMIDRNYAVEAGGFVLLTEDTANVMMIYIQHGIGNLLETDIPPYNNDSGTVYLLNFDSLATEWFSYNEDMHFPLLDDVNGVSLERLDVNRDVADNGSWHSAAETVGFGTPGLENSQYYPTSEADGEVSMDPEIFSPDNDGYNDILNINYTFTQPGNVATIRIYDANGRPMRELATNELLAASGTFTWDGTTDTGEKARIGMYVIFFEAFNTEGKTSRFKLSTVLGGQL